MDQQEFVSELSKLRSSSMFLTLHGYRNEHSEVADYSIIFHMSYRNALERSIVQLNSLSLSSDLEKLACKELLESFSASLSKVEETPIEEIDDAYTRFYDEDNSYIKGVKLHTKTGILHLYGLVNNKRILMPGMYPVRNKRPLTVAKDKLRYFTAVGKFRQFKIQSSQVDKICVENISLLPPE